MNIQSIETAPTEIVPLLEEAIQQLIGRLEAYSGSPNANQFYIDQQNETLGRLYKVYNELNSFKYLSIWKDLEQTMEKIEQIDSEIPGHTILFRTRERGIYPSIIDKYW